MPSVIISETELTEHSEISCTFCGLTGSWLNPMVINPSRTTGICGMCVAKFAVELKPLVYLNTLNPNDMTRQ